MEAASRFELENKGLADRLPDRLFYIKNAILHCFSVYYVHTPVQKM
jgi:hypothetical protein